MFYSFLCRGKQSAASRGKSLQKAFEDPMLELYISFYTATIQYLLQSLA